jgi:hypothetical protein
MEPMTLDEIGVLLMKAVRKLSVEVRKRLAAALLDARGRATLLRLRHLYL